MYEQVLINALEEIIRKPSLPIPSHPLGGFPCTINRCADIAQSALTEYKALARKERDRMYCSIRKCHELAVIQVVIDMREISGRTFKINLCKGHEHLQNKITISQKERQNAE
jgi:hypothetical protein